MGFFDSLFSTESTTKSFTDYSNPYVLDAINRSSTLSKTGLSDDILSKMRRRLRLAADRKQAGSRASTTSRLTREGVPLQAREQILADLSSSQLGELEQGLLGVDLGNEEMKFKALELLGSLGKGLTVRQKSTTRSADGGWLGDLVQGGLNYFDPFNKFKKPNPLNQSSRPTNSV